MFRELLTMLCVFCTMALPAIAQNRHALVIGINEYAQIEPLQKAVNDARAVADAFQQVGFQADLLVDPDAEQMGLGLDRFIARLSPGDEAVFYFAGHGVELGGQTFLLPSDVSAESERVLRRQAYLVNDLMTDIRLRGVRATVMILDACRNNPFPPSSPARSIVRSGGLGAVQSPPEGSFILYSAAAGEVALDALSRDDPNPNSVFTRALLPRITQPGLTLTQLSRDVRVETRRLAQTIGQDQFSAFYDQLEGDFVFTPAAAIAPNQVSPVEGPTDPCAAALPVWNAIQDSDNRVALEGFVGSYASACPVLAALAQERLVTVERPALSTLSSPPDTDRDVALATPPTLKGQEVGRQTTGVADNLATDVSLSPSADVASTTQIVPQDEAIFNAARGVGTRRGWDIFLSRHPDSTFADLARTERETLLVADLAAASGTRISTDGRTEIAPDVARQAEADLGLSRDDARAVQQALNERGYDAGPVDGAIGRRTRVAVADFQLAVGLPSTGVVTAATSEALGVTLNRAEERPLAIVASRNARRYNFAQLALLEDDPRLLDAVRVFGSYEMIYGFFEGRLYVALLTWSGPSYDEIDRRARTIGGHLVSIGSAAENRFVIDLVADDDRFWQPIRNEWVNGPMIGLKQAENAREPDGGWAWTTGEPVTFLAWHLGQPNNNEGRANLGSLGYLPRGGTVTEEARRYAAWDDSVTTTRGFIIEIE